MSVTPGQRDWLRVREYLMRHRYRLGQEAAALYPDTPQVAGTVLLTRPQWLPAEPLPLDAIDLEFAPATPFTGLTGTDPVTAAVRPPRPDGSPYPTYSAAMADLAAPAVFENRPTYRLLDADLSGPRGHLKFGRGRYFDGIDVGESAAHEYAAGRLDAAAREHATGQRDAGAAPLRAAIGDPCDPARRPMNIGVSALTIRHERGTGAARFLLHWRDPAKVGHAGGLYMVVPVGIFQAAGASPAHERHDFSLWRCMIREYAEELLGEPEDHGSGAGPVDYEHWPFAARMTDALRTGRIRAHVVGMGVDPLTLVTDLLIVVVIDAGLFDELFADLAPTNDEGRLVGAAAGRPTEGVPFTAGQLGRLAREPVQAAGSAALSLARRHRRLLLGGQGLGG